MAINSIWASLIHIFQSNPQLLNHHFSRCQHGLWWPNTTRVTMCSLSALGAHAHMRTHTQTRIIKRIIYLNHAVVHPCHHSAHVGKESVQTNGRVVQRVKKTVTEIVSGLWHPIGRIRLFYEWCLIHDTVRSVNKERNKNQREALETEEWRTCERMKEEGNIRTVWAPLSPDRWKEQEGSLLTQTVLIYHRHVGGESACVIFEHSTSCLGGCYWYKKTRTHLGRGQSARGNPYPVKSKENGLTCDAISPSAFWWLSLRLPREQTKPTPPTQEKAPQDCKHTE